MNRINNNLNKDKRQKNKKSSKDDNIKKNSKKTKNSSTKNNSNKKKHPILRAIRSIFVLLLILIIAFGVWFYKKTEENGGGLKGALCTILGQSVEDLDSLEPINVLLLGISEDLDSELTDTIILCSYNPQTQTASMLSIPRDTFVGKSESSAKGSDKINSLYSKGVQKTVDAVSEITGVDIDYYAVVHISNLIEIVDIIGGVEFEVPIDMDYDDPTQDLHIHLSQGMQIIDGEKAEQLLRFRHNNDGTSYPAEYGDNDYGRMKTQRAFIEATLQQTLTFENIFNARKILNTIFNNMETNLTKDVLYPYIPSLVDLDLDAIISEQLPGESKKCNGLWFFIYSKSQTQKLVESLNIK